MAKFKPQYRRLLFIDQKLRDSSRGGKLPNCTSLADEWETSPRTIQRDIEFLKWEMDAPIEYDRSRHGYYYSEPDFVLPALRIGEGDLFAICLAEKVLRQYGVYGSGWRTPRASVVGRERWGNSPHISTPPPRLQRKCQKVTQILKSDEN